MRRSGQGTDIAFLLGRDQLLLDNDKMQWEYVKAFTNASYIVKEGFGFQDGLFTGYDEAEARLRPLELGLRDRRGRLRHGRRHAAEPALRLEPAEAACRASTRRRWSSASAARPRTSS